MKLRYLVAAGLVVATVISAVGIAVVNTRVSPLPAPSVQTELTSLPDISVERQTLPRIPMQRGDPIVGPVTVPIAVQMAIPVLITAPRIDLLGAISTEPYSAPWNVIIAAGDTFDVLLARAGVDNPARSKIALAVQNEFDLRKLRPGHTLSVASTSDGGVVTVSLGVDDGVTIVVELADTVQARIEEPDVRALVRASQLSVEGSIFASLDRAGVPSRFAVDLAQMLGGTVDFRRDLRAGDALQLLWQETVLPNGAAIGTPTLTYSALTLDGRTFEIIWPEDGSGATIYADGNVLRTFSQPVNGARLSSVFGQRRHPIYGNLRMHTGVDYAAAKGAPISATGPGRVSFIGQRRGYGRVIEIAHGTDTMTRYAHLSAVTKGLSVGARVLAGEIIGAVGQTGTATGPNLHYEVHVGGRPVDPLSDERMANLSEPDKGAAELELEAIRTKFAQSIESQT